MAYVERRIGIGNSVVKLGFSAFDRYYLMEE